MSGFGIRASLSEVAWIAGVGAYSTIFGGALVVVSIV